MNEAYLNVHFLITKGLGPEQVEKVIGVFIDDIQPEMSDQEVMGMAKQEAEHQLYNSEDFPHYGKNWVHTGTYYG